MATQTVRVNLGRLSGTYTADVYLDGSNTTFAIDRPLTAEAQPGFYTFTLTSSAGLYSIIAKESGGRIGSGYVRTNDTAATFAAGGTRDEVNAATERATLQASVNDVPTNAELMAAFAASDGATLDAIAELPTAAEIFAATLTTALTESYASDGVAPTLAQLLFLIQSHLNESSISGTTKTVRKLDGSTTAATFTLDSATDPTSITRAT